VWPHGAQGRVGPEAYPSFSFRFAPRTAYYFSFRGSRGWIPGAHAIAILVVASFFLVGSIEFQ